MQKLIKMIPILEKSLLQNGINGISIYTHIVDGYIICDRRKEINLPHPDGDLRIKLPNNTETIKPLRLKGKGYKMNNGNGDFYLKLNIVNEPLTEDIKNELIEYLK